MAGMRVSIVITVHRREALAKGRSGSTLLDVFRSLLQAHGFRVPPEDRSRVVNRYLFLDPNLAAVVRSGDRPLAWQHELRPLLEGLPAGEESLRLEVDLLDELPGKEEPRMPSPGQSRLELAWSWPIPDRGWAADSDSDYDLDDSGSEAFSLDEIARPAPSGWAPDLPSDLAPEVAPRSMPPAARGAPTAIMPRASAGPSRSRAKKGVVAVEVERRGTVRYYSRMNPWRLFPLLVVVSRAEIQRAVEAGVAQAEGGPFRAEVGSAIEVEPILPGCACYPPKAEARIAPGDVEATFWVVPQVLGRLTRARVEIRQQGRTLAEIPLDVRVTRQTAAVVLGLLGLLAPFAVAILKKYRLDFESQVEEGFGRYAQLLSLGAERASPAWVAVGLLVVAGLVYLRARPRRRDAFWGVARAAG